MSQAVAAGAVTKDEGALPKPVGAFPSWVKVPEGLVIPRGRPIVPVRFLAEHTYAPEKGERQAILWPLSDEDEGAALGRAMGDHTRLPGEYSKAMIRAFDGTIVASDGSTEAGLRQFWGDLGTKYRNQIWNLYLQLHRLSDEQRKVFFADCIAVVHL